MVNERRKRSDVLATDLTDSLVSEDAVRARAYQLFQARGAEHGHDLDDWLQAKRELQFSNDRTFDRRS